MNFIKYPFRFLLYVCQHSKSFILVTKCSAHLDDIEALKGTDSRVLFQSADGKINMGVWFNDPDIEMNDIFWYNIN